MIQTYKRTGYENSGSGSGFMVRVRVSGSWSRSGFIERKIYGKI